MKKKYHGFPVVSDTEQHFVPTMEEHAGGLFAALKLIVEILKLDEHHHWTKQVLERDGHTCRICKSKEKWVFAHRLIPLDQIVEMYSIKTLKQARDNRLLWDINWGVTLCRECLDWMNEKEVPVRRDK